jgi:hypothetical protein
MGGQIEDGALFLFAPFLFHPTLEESDEAGPRRERVLAALRAARCIPDPEEWLFPAARSDAASLSFSLRRMWQRPSGPTDRLDGGWYVRSFGVTYHETLGVLLGVRRQAVPSSSTTPTMAEWLACASDRWHQTFEPDPECPPWPPLDMLEHRDLFGRTWVWTGEWSEPPAEGWECFGRKHYPDGCVRFPWGVLGYSAATASSFATGSEGLGRFDLHVLSAEEDVRERTRFLLSALIIILTEFLKTTEYIWDRYQHDYASLVTEESTVLQLYDPERETSGEILKPIDHAAVRALNRTLFPLSRKIGNVQHDVLSARVARDDIQSQLAVSGGKVLSGTGLVFPGQVGRIADQMASDVSYFRVAEHSGMLTIQALQLEVDLDNLEVERRNTHLEQMILAAQLVLTSVGFGLATAVGVWQIFQGILSDGPYKGAAIFAISLVVGIAGGYVSWRLWLPVLRWVFPGMRRQLDRLIRQFSREER